MLPGAGRVQVDESGPAGRVAHAFHQLTRVGTCLSDELVTGMAQVVQVNAETGCGECDNNRDREGPLAESAVEHAEGLPLAYVELHMASAHVSV